MQLSRVSGIAFVIVGVTHSCCGSFFVPLVRLRTIPLSEIVDLRNEICCLAKRIETHCKALKDPVSHGAPYCRGVSCWCPQKDGTAAEKISAFDRPLLDFVLWQKVCLHGRKLQSLGFTANMALCLFVEPLVLYHAARMPGISPPSVSRPSSL